jgi:hypothetical protein
MAAVRMAISAKICAKVCTFPFDREKRRGLMSDQNAAQPQKAPVVVTSAQDMVRGLIAQLPSMSVMKEQLGLVCGVYAQFVVGPTQVDLKDALNDLAAFFDTDADGLKQAIAEINQVISKESMMLAAEFKEKTGRDLDLKTLDIQPAVLEERTEQQSATKLALDMRSQVRTIVVQLGVRDIFTEKQQVKGAKKEPSKGRLLEKMADVLAARKLLVKKEEIPAETEDALAQENPDWLTPPVLDSSDPEVATVKRKLDAVIRVMQRYSAESNMKEASLAALANMNTPVDVLEELIERTQELVEKQLAQSKSILAGVDEDEKTFHARVQALQDVKIVYGSVMRYFFPSK